MTRTITVCPECAGTRIAFNSGNGMLEGESHYLCRDCGERFEKPAERESHGHGGAGGSSLVAKLTAADPEEVAR